MSQMRQTRKLSFMEVSKETRRRNLLVASGCGLFVFGVWYYSVSAVGGGGGIGGVGQGRDELEEAIKEDEVKINVHQSGELRASGAPKAKALAQAQAEAAEGDVEGKKTGGRGEAETVRVLCDNVCFY